MTAYGQGSTAAAVAPCPPARLPACICEQQRLGDYVPDTAVRRTSRGPSEPPSSGTSSGWLSSVDPCAAILALQRGVSFRDQRDTAVTLCYPDADDTMRELFWITSRSSGPEARLHTRGLDSCSGETAK